MANKLPLGLVIYNGPSQIDGKPIVAIVTGISRPSQNAKTGPMLQTWILAARVNPVQAINTGYDKTVCGDCPLRGTVSREGTRLRNRGRGCYVEVKNAPNQVWRSWKAGSYETYDRATHSRHFRGRKLRLGAYGDPAAVPYHIWSELVELADGHTGYTHQHKERRFRRFRKLVMASVETLEAAQDAACRGWRTFRSSLLGDIAPGEIVCPASEEAGYTRTCATCGACDGAGANPGKVSVTILAHGSPATTSSYRKAVAV